MMLEKDSTRMRYWRRLGGFASGLCCVVLLAAGSGCAPAQPSPLPPTPAASATPAPPPLPTASLTPQPTPLPVLRVAVDAANPPWFETNGSGTQDGIDAEVLAALGRQMGVRFEVVSVAPHLLAQELAAHRVDLAAGGLVSTTERAQAMSLSRPYLSLQQVVVLHGVDSYSGPGVLAGRTTGAQIGTRSVAEAGKAGAAVKLYDDLAIALAALSRGEVKAVVGERPAAAALLRENPQWGLRLDSSIGTPLPVALAVAKDNAALLARLNTALEALAARGELAALEKRWLQ